MVRVDLLAACLIGVVLAPNHAGGSPESIPAGQRAPVQAKLGPGLSTALTQAIPSAGIAIAVALQRDDLPPPGAARRAAIAARQQRVLDSLPAAGFRVRYRYESVSGLAGWAQPAAVDKLLAHSESSFVYLDGTMNATLAEGSSLIGAPSVHSQGFTGAGIRVAFLDSGIDTDHPHLSDDIAAQQCFCDDHPSPQLGCPSP